MKIGPSTSEVYSHVDLTSTTPFSQRSLTGDGDGAGYYAQNAV